MSGHTVLVSGGTGFVGRFIVERLLAGGRAVVVMGRNQPSAAGLPRAVGFRHGHLDAADPAAFGGIDSFVHAAFDHLPGKFRGGEGEDPDTFVARNLEGSVRLFAAARAAGVRRAVFLSSRAVYGKQPAGSMLTEATEPRPDTLYGSVKLACEQRLAALQNEGFRVTSLRITGVYGPAAPGLSHKWSGLFHEFLAGRPIEPRIATEVHGEDVAAAVSLVLGTPADAGTCNVSDLVLDRRDLLGLLKKATASHSALPEAADRSALNVMTTDRLAALGWRPQGRAALEAFVRREAHK